MICLPRDHSLILSEAMGQLQTAPTNGVTAALAFLRNPEQLGAEMEVWTNLLQTFGLASMIIVAGGYGLWRMVVWIGRELVIPIRDNLIAAMKQQMALVEKQWDASHKERDIERELRHQATTRMTDAIDETHETANKAKEEILAKLSTVCRYNIPETNRRGPRQQSQMRPGESEQTPT